MAIALAGCALPADETRQIQEVALRYQLTEFGHFPNRQVTVRAHGFDSKELKAALLDLDLAFEDESVDGAPERTSCWAGAPKRSGMRTAIVDTGCTSTTFVPEKMTQAHRMRVRLGRDDLGEWRVVGTDWEEMT